MDNKSIFKIGVAVSIGIFLFIGLFALGFQDDPTPVTLSGVVLSLLELLGLAVFTGLLFSGSLFLAKSITNAFTKLFSSKKL